MEAVAKLRNVPTSPRKMRMVADLIRGKKVNKALSLLKFEAKEGAPRLEKLVLSAISNWQISNEDARLEDADLYIKSITVDGGKKWKQIKNGIPPIQVKDLTIQRRENDLVVATFGRGFYVLDDYTVLRELSEEVSKTSAHIFGIEDALLYFPSSNLNNQREVHFRTPNPDPSATFKYYIKNFR